MTATTDSTGETSTPSAKSQSHSDQQNVLKKQQPSQQDTNNHTLRDIASMLKDVVSTLNIVQSDVHDLTSTIVSIKDSLSTLDSKVRYNENNIDSNLQRISKLEENVHQLQIQRNTNEKEIQNHSSMIVNLQHDLNNLKTHNSNIIHPCNHDDIKQKLSDLEDIKSEISLINSSHKDTERVHDRLDDFDQSKFNNIIVLRGHLVNDQIMHIDESKESALLDLATYLLKLMLT